MRNMPEVKTIMNHELLAARAAFIARVIATKLTSEGAEKAALLVQRTRAAKKAPFLEQYRRGQRLQGEGGSGSESGR